MSEIGIKIIIGMMLLICAVQDIRKKKISLLILILGAIFISVCLPFYKNISILDRIGGIAVGIIVVIISKATAGKIGMGDGLLLCITGLGLGFWGNLELFGIALFFSAVVAIILLVCRLADRKKSIPFVPFLLLSYVFTIALAASKVAV